MITSTARGPVTFVQARPGNLIHRIDIERRGYIEMQAMCGFVPVWGWEEAWNEHPDHHRRCERCYERSVREYPELRLEPVKRDSVTPFLDLDVIHEAWHKDSQFMCLDSQTADEHMDLVRYVYTIATEAASA